jgi:hypothetical protein
MTMNALDTLAALTTLADSIDPDAKFYYIQSGDQFYVSPERGQIATWTWNPSLTTLFKSKAAASRIAAKFANARALPLS